MTIYIIIGLIGAISLQTIAFLTSLRLKRVDVVDVAWGLSAIAIAIALQLYQPSTNLSVLLGNLLVSLWGSRLAWHIIGRLNRTKEQDPRYTKLMINWPKNNLTWQIYTKIFLLQAVLATIVSLPMIVLHYNNSASIQLFNVIGLIIWAIGFLTETLADSQLKHFLQTAKKNSLMQSGLWKYSRHPNYLGEIIMWWGLALMSLQNAYWWVALIGAAAISYLIIFVSGIPLAEASMESKPQWSDYKAKTSVLIPLPIKK